MESHRLPLKCYNMLNRFETPNWVSHVKEILFRFGFGFVWLNQGVVNIRLFLTVFENRLKDNYLQIIENNINPSENMSFYFSITDLTYQSQYYIKRVSNFKT